MTVLLQIRSEVVFKNSKVFVFRLLEQDKSLTAWDSIFVLIAESSLVSMVSLQTKK